MKGGLVLLLVCVVGVVIGQSSPGLFLLFF